ncbi:MAG: hypothetical protein COV44_08025 [Deltaproteobacteria bacterium CG11_big_fil_rev_8_21_14_0_20_45_16]|nr:MAG: hypothetical protein COV44_08025 [Deltaproteobacteria bacterium CG11_big_fil_rev_8_21_14_0_20_45_16]
MTGFIFSILGVLSIIGDRPVTDYPEDVLNTFFSDVWSPYCKGNSLLDCPSGKAEELRKDLRERYHAGDSIDELRIILNNRYGDQIKMEPASDFRGKLSYLLPWAAFLVAIGGVILFWRRKSRFQSNLAAKPTSNAASSTRDRKVDNRILDDLDERLG